MTEQMSLVVFDPIKAVSADLEKKDAAQEFDHTTPEGEKDLRSWVHRVRLHKGAIEKVRVAAKAGVLEFGHKVDDLARELTLSPQKIIDARMKPLDEIEAAKRAEAEALIKAEQEAAEKAETERLADLKRREDEVARKEAELKVAEDAANAEQREAERIIRERRIAEEAAETAKKLAEANAAKQAEAFKKAIQDNADRKERIRLEESEAKAAVERMDAEVKRRRIADTKHRDKIESEIFSVLVRMVTLSSDAENIVEAIKNGKIPHLIIKY